MAATHAFNGVGTIAGRAVIEGTGRSVGDILGNGNDDMKLAAERFSESSGLAEQCNESAEPFTGISDMLSGLNAYAGTSPRTCEKEIIAS